MSEVKQKKELSSNDNSTIPEKIVFIITSMEQATSVEKKELLIDPKSDYINKILKNINQQILSHAC